MRIGTPLPKALQRVSESNLEALRGYRPLAWDGRIVLFRARAPVVGLFYDPVAAWEALARGGVETIPMPGDHVTIIEEPNVAVLAESLRRCVERAQASPDGSSEQTSAAV